MSQRSASDAVATVESYALALTESRIDDLVALFTEDAELRDPFDGPILRGRAALSEFFGQGAALVDRLSVSGPVRVTGDLMSAAAPMLAEVTMQGASIDMDSVDVFFFDDAGLISAMHAFYGPTNVRPKAQ